MTYRKKKYCISLLYLKKGTNPMFNNTTFTITGRLAAKPAIFANSDGSRKVAMTVYARRNQPNAKGEFISDALNVEAFLPAAQVNKSLANGKDGNAIYSWLNKGDLLTIAGHFEASTYTDKSGQKVYAQVLRVDNLATLEAKSVRDNRAAQAQAPQAQVQAPQAQVQAQPQAQQAPAMVDTMPNFI